MWLLRLAFIVLSYQCFWAYSKTGGNSAAYKSLGRYQIHKDWITASGHSSGASFVHQFQLVHSYLVHGIGVFSGLYYQYNGLPAKPFILGEDDVDPPGVGVENSIKYLYYYSRTGKVYVLRYLKNKKVFIFAGTADQFHGPDQRLYAMEKIYEPLLQDPRNQLKLVIKYAPHALQTGVCTPEALEMGYDCDYNALQDMLRFLYDWRLKEPGNQPVKIQEVQKFNQKEFTKDLTNSSMAEFGFIYIPTGCLSATIPIRSNATLTGKKNQHDPLNKCLLHMFLHGCTTWKNGFTSIYKLQYLYEVAELNNMIVVMPLVKATKINPQGCWDYVGYSGIRYATIEGPQIRVLRRIIRRISGR